MPYSKEVNTKHPQLVVLGLDTSYSMGEQVGEDNRHGIVPGADINRIQVGHHDLVRIGRR